MSAFHSFYSIFQRFIQYSSRFLKYRIDFTNKTLVFEFCRWIAWSFILFDVLPDSNTIYSLYDKLISKTVFIYIVPIRRVIFFHTKPGLRRLVFEPTTISSWDNKKKSNGRFWIRNLTKFSTVLRCLTRLLLKKSHSNWENSRC